jgi:hypothetical protein
MLPAKKLFIQIGLPIALLFGMVCVAASAQTSLTSFTPSPNEWGAGSTASYLELLGDAQAGYIPERLDFTQLRLKYAENPDYNPEYGSGQISAMYQFLDKKEYGAALDLASMVLARQYVNIDAHVVAARAYEAMCDGVTRVDVNGWFSGRAKLHALSARSLIRSIYASAGDGDNPACLVDGYTASCGTSMATALKLISLQEEGALARAGQLREVGRSSITNDGRDYNVVSFVNTSDNSSVKLYFDVTLPERHAQRSSPQ